MGPILFILLLLAAFGAFAYAFFPKLQEEHNGYGNEDTPTKIRKVGLLAGGALIFLAILSTGIKQIDAGHVGVIRRFSAVTGEVMQPGLAWMPPFISSVDDVDTRVRSIHIDNYTAASKEQQDLFLNLTLNYHVDPIEAPHIIQNIGDDFEAKIVTPRLLDIPKSITDDYPTSIVLNSRDEIRSKAEELLSGALAPYGFIVDNIALENFAYSPEYNASIEAKQIAQQQVETEKQRLAQAQIAAQTLVAQAKGQADAAIEAARGEAAANDLVNKSLTQNILLNRYIEKLAPGVKTILLPADNNNGFIFNLGDEVKTP